MKHRKHWTRRSHRRSVTTLAALVAVLGAALFSVTVPAWADGGLEITAPADGGSATWSSTGITFSGTTTETATVLVYDVDENLVCSSAVTAGSWSCISTGPLPVGLHTYTAAQATSGAPLNDTIAFTLVPPPPSVDQSSPVTVEYSGNLAFSGRTTVTNATITVTVTSLGSCSTGPWPLLDSVWNCSWSGVSLTPGDYSFSVVQQSAGIDSPAVSGTVRVVNGVAITVPSNGADVVWDADPFLVVGGTAVSGGTVDVAVAGSTACSTTASGGSWNCPAVSTPPGSTTISAAKSASTDSITVDVVLPAPTVTGPLTFLPGTSEAGITGTVNYPGASVLVELYEDFGEGGFILVRTATCDDDGGVFECLLDLDGLGQGIYVLDISHYLSSDPTVNGVVESLDLRIDDGTYGGAPLTCVYGPASVNISGGDAFLYRITPTASGYQLADPGRCNGVTGYDPGTVAGWNDTFVQDCFGSCSVGNLTPGIYELYIPGSGAFDYDYLFRVPTTPTVTTSASSGSTVVLGGSATANDRLRVLAPSGATLCSTTVTAGGTWACAFPASDVDSARAVAIDPQSGGMSARSAARAIATSDDPVTDPTIEQELVSWVLTFGDLSNLKPGDRVGLTIGAMPVGTEIEVWIHSTPTLLTTATGTGAPLDLEFTIPMDIEPGAHRIEVLATTPLGVEYSFDNPATVVGDDAAGPTDGSTDGTAGSGDPDDGVGGGAGARSDRSLPASPSALTAGIPTLAEILDNPISLALAGGLAVAIMVLIALPTEILNSSLEANSARFGRFSGFLDRTIGRGTEWFIRVTRSRAVAAAILTLLVALIFGFVDPSFGFDLVSLRMVLSLGSAFFLLGYVATKLGGIVIERLWGVRHAVQIQPAIVLFAIAGVILARILEFSPGFLVGIAIGLELVAASRVMEVRAVLVQLGFVVGFSVLAWVVYSVWTPGQDFGSLYLHDALVATTAEGLTGAMIAVFPLTFMDGRVLWDSSKRLWAIVFGGVGLAFALLVLPTAMAGTEVSDVAVWVAVLAGFGALTMAVWYAFVRITRREQPVEERATVDA